MKDLRKQFQEETQINFENIPINGAHLEYINWLEKRVANECVAESSQGWISVKDRLPDNYCHVLIYCPQTFPNNCRFLSANYYDDNQLFYGDSDEAVHEDVTHWMIIEDPKP